MSICTFWSLFGAFDRPSHCQSCSKKSTSGCETTNLKLSAAIRRPMGHVFELHLKLRHKLRSSFLGTESSSPPTLVRVGGGASLGQRAYDEQGLVT